MSAKPLVNVLIVDLPFGFTFGMKRICVVASSASNRAELSETAGNVVQVGAAVHGVVPVAVRGVEAGDGHPLRVARIGIGRVRTRAC